MCIHIYYLRYKHIAEESPHIYIHVKEVLSDVRLLNFKFEFQIDGGTGGGSGSDECGRAECQQPTQAQCGRPGHDEPTPQGELIL